MSRNSTNIKKYGGVTEVKCVHSFNYKTISAFLTFVDRKVCLGHHPRNSPNLTFSVTPFLAGVLAVQDLWPVSAAGQGS